MSVKGPELKALVVQRLVAAAEEIFALFEQNLAEYHDELIHSKLLQQPEEEINREEICPEPIKVKLEEDSIFSISSVKSEENITKSAVQKRLEEQNEPYSVLEQCEPEPGYSGKLHLSNNDKHNSCSDTDNSSDWDLADKKPNKYKRKAGFKKKSGQNSVTHDVQLHRRFLKKQRPFSCSICGMKFNYLSTQKRHVRRIHNKERPYACTVCHKRFFRNYDFLNHMMIHTGERPYRCSECGLNFRYKRRLELHRCSQKQSLDQEQTEENDDSTERQMFDFQTVAVNVNRSPEPTNVKHGGAEPGCSVDNEQIHNGSQTNHLNDCEFMNERFHLDQDEQLNDLLNDSELTDERSTESKVNHVENSAANNDLEHRSCEERECCPVCGMFFTYRSTLLRHIRRIHNKERNYSCSLCQRSFFRKYEYESHLMSHTGELPFTCSLCGKSYRHKKNLKDHSCLRR